ncbi:MAG: DUF2190 family protein [Opitutales bacterium]|nr:DUF2190 family protein [Opitutales bacterium]
MSIVIAILIVVALLGAGWWFWGRERFGSFCNSLPGTHFGSVTRMTDAAVASRFLLGRVGSDEEHVAICGASNVPFGIIDDSASGAEEDVAVQLLGCAGSTVRMLSAGAVPAGSLVYTAANGRVSTLSATAGIYYCVGMALISASGADELIEVDPCVPVKTVV